MRDREAASSGTPVSYVAFLRGINVGGHVVKMERLRQVFAGLGLGGVRSYINSGNIFFHTTEKDRSSLTETIEDALQGALGYEVPTFLRTPEELQEVIERAPFAEVEKSDDLRFCVVFTAEALGPGLALPFSSTKNDMELVAINEREAYVIWRIVGGRPPSGKFPSDVLPARNTTRFFHTLKKILEAARA